MADRLDAAHSVLRRTGIPKGWREAGISELADVVGGGTPDRQQSDYWRNGSVPWITPTDLTSNQRKYIRSGAENISELGLENSNAMLVPAGSVVFSTRGTVGSLAIAEASLTCNQSCEVLIPRDKTNPEFLFYLLDYGHSAFIRLSGGTTFGAITRRDIARVKFAIPPNVYEQAAISRILDAVDAALECTRTAVERAQDFQSSLLHELLERGLAPIGSINSKERCPKHWKRVSVDDVATVGSGVTLGKDVSGQKTVELPYLRVANVQDGHLDLTTIKTVRVPVGDAEKFRLQPGDVLMTEGGDIDKLGRGTIWEAQIPDCLHQNHVFRIRPNRELLEPAFYALIVESDIAKRYFSRVAKRTTNLASTNKTQVRAFQFPLPPTTSEQRQIVDIVTQAKAMSVALSMKEAGLRELKKSLMHDLLTGKVRVGEIAEEPPR